MPEYLAPGVYVEEVNTGPRPIEGVSTSTAGFVGETERGPTRPTPGHQLAGLPALVRRLHRPAADQRGELTTCPTRSAGSSTTAASACSSPRVDRRRRRSRRRQPGRAPAGPTVVDAIGTGDWGNNVRLRRRTGVGRLDSAAAARRPGQQWFRLRVALLPRRVPNPLRRSHRSDAARQSRTAASPTPSRTSTTCRPVATDRNFAQHGRQRRARG